MSKLTKTNTHTHKQTRSKGKKCFLFLKPRCNLAVSWGLEREPASHPARCRLLPGNTEHLALKPKPHWAESRDAWHITGTTTQTQKNVWLQACTDLNEKSSPRRTPPNIYFRWVFSLSLSLCVCVPLSGNILDS